MNFTGKTGPYIIAILSCLPILFWLPYASFINVSAILRSIGQVTALVGTALFSLNFILSARIPRIEALFSGLNRVYIVHSLSGAIAFILILFHPTAILLGYLTVSLGAAVDLITPSFDNIPVLTGISALLLMIVLMLLTLYIKIEYDSWKRTHQYLGFVLFLAAAHSLLIGSTLGASLPLRIYMYAIMAIAAAAFVYKLLSRRMGIYRHHFTVEKVSVGREATVLTLTPNKTMFPFIPGQFAFINAEHLGVPKDSHPFTIVSDPASKTLSFAIKSLGDFTETMKLLTPGTPIEVEGPFGRFSYHYYKNRHQLWIAGGIGVTPFISMLRSLPREHGYFITFIYSVRERSEVLFAQELHDLQTKIPDFHLHIWPSTELGRLTADNIDALVLNLDRQEVFICGPPPMMASLRRGLLKHHVRNSHIHTEEFSLS